MKINYSLVAIILVLIVMIACKENVITLDKADIRRISYAELPLEVKTFIENNIDSIINSNHDVHYSTNPEDRFTYGRSGAAETWIEEINSNYHHFFVNGRHYRLKGNQGDPFVLHKGVLYFGDLNLYEDNYTDKTYYRINLDKE